MEKFQSFFLQDTFKTAFQMRNRTLRLTQSGHFLFRKSGHFISIFKKGQGRPPPIPLANCTFDICF